MNSTRRWPRWVGYFLLLGAGWWPVTSAVTEIKASRVLTYGWLIATAVTCLLSFGMGMALVVAWREQGKTKIKAIGVGAAVAVAGFLSNSLLEIILPR